MTKAFAFLRRNALSIALVLVSLALAASVYTVLHQADVRTASILRECRDQNRRHTNTIRELDYVLAQALKHAPKSHRAEIAASRADTVLLIDALAPYQNCQQVAARASRP